MAPFLESWLAKLTDAKRQIAGRGTADAAVYLATGFGSGYAPTAPGTVGTLIAVPIAALTMSGGVAFHVLCTLLLTCAAIPISTIAEIELKQKDASAIVLDEIVGFMWAVVWVPLTVGWWVIAFLLFRYFDIAKPSFIGRSQNLPSGIGIVVDDVLAGLAAGILIALTVLIFS